MDRFASKVILITGASSGIGAAIAKGFAKHGARLSLTGRKKDNLAGVAKECKDLGAEEVFEIVADLQKEESADEIMKETISHFGELNVLVNNAGIIVWSSVENFTAAQYDEIFTVNLKAPMLLSQKAIPYLEKTKGCIVNMSGYAADIYNFLPLYTATKAALNHFTKTSALELARKGIRVNAVSPGYSPTEIVYRAGGFTREEADALWEGEAKKHPLWETLIEKDQIVNAILFLASDSAKMITWTILPVDSGRTLTGQ